MVGQGRKAGTGNPTSSVKLTRLNALRRADELLTKASALVQEACDYVKLGAGAPRQDKRMLASETYPTMLLADVANDAITGAQTMVSHLVRKLENDSGK